MLIILASLQHMKTHHYESKIIWDGNTGTGTENYRNYSRDHRIITAGKADILGSSDAAFRGDASRHSPEDMLLASVATCHMLWYLHLCATAGVVVVAYEDNAEGTMVEHENGSGQFTQIILKPIITITDAGKQEKALQLHDEAHKYCFIANSCNFPIVHQPVFKIG